MKFTRRAWLNSVAALIGASYYPAAQAAESPKATASPNALPTLDALPKLFIAQKSRGLTVLPGRYAIDHGGHVVSLDTQTVMVRIEIEVDGGYVVETQQGIRCFFPLDPKRCDVVLAKLRYRLVPHILFGVGQDADGFVPCIAADYIERYYPTLVMAGKTLEPMAQRGEFLIRGVDNFRCLGRRVDATVVEERSATEFIIRVEGEKVKLVLDADDKENISGMRERFFPEIRLASLWWTEERRWRMHISWRWPTNLVSGRSYRRQPCEA